MIAVLKNVMKQRDEREGYRLVVRRLSIRRGAHIAVTGPSGCGKSTTLDLLGMVLRPDAADSFLLVDGEQEIDIFRLWENGRRDLLTNLRRRHLGYVLQTGELFPFLNVKENIVLTAETAGVGKKEAHSRADELMERLEIVHLAKALPRTLSIGERQRVAIARAVAPKPQLLLADEPTAALDPGLSRKVMRLFLDIVGESGASVVMVSHDVDLVREFGFREVPVIVEHGESEGLSAIVDEQQGGR